MIRLSIGMSKEYKAKVITYNTKELAVKVEKHKFNIHKRNSDILEEVIRGIQLLITEIDKEMIKPDIKEYVVIEFKNKHVYKWITEYKVPKDYAKEMIKLLYLLDKIPFRIQITYSDLPIAVNYATETRYNKEKEVYSNSLDEFMTKPEPKLDFE